MKVICTREPGGIRPSEEIRGLVFKLKEEGLIGAEGQMLLFFAARKFWKNQLVKPSIEKGVNVLSDRTYTSTGAYQGYGEGGDKIKILRIADIVMGDIKPDAIILLDVSSKTSQKRRGVDVQGDPFDCKNIDYLNRVVAGYREMARIGWGGLNWYIVDGEGGPFEVSESVAKVLENVFEKKLDRFKTD